MGTELGRVLNRHGTDFAVQPRPWAAIRGHADLERCGPEQPLVTRRGHPNCTLKSVLKHIRGRGVSWLETNDGTCPWNS
jgi:hypothetical protein